MIKEKFRQLFSYIEKRWSGDNMPGVLSRFFSMGMLSTNSGVAVSEGNALAYSTVYACVTLIAQTLAMLPLIVYQRKGEGKERATNHYLYPILHDMPCSTMNSFTWREFMQGGLLLNGNCYAPLVRDGAGRVRAIPAVLPGDVSVVKDSKGIFYNVTGNDMPGVYSRDNMLHVMNFSRDGVRGLSPIAVAREAIGLGLACEAFGSLFFGNGINPGMVISHPTTLSDDAYRHLKESITTQSGGLGKSHLMMLLEEGMKLEKYGMPLEDAQFLATRSFQRSEICSIYKVPPHMIGDVEKTTSWGTGIEQQQTGFVTYTVLQWLVRWEQELNLKLLSDKERAQGIFIEFLLDGLLRADAKTRSETLNIQRRAGIINGNEWRAKENMNPYAGGEVYLISQDMAPIDAVIKGTAKAGPPSPNNAQGAQQ